MHFNVNFNVFFKLIKVYWLVSELCIYQNVRYNDKKKVEPCFCSSVPVLHVAGRHFTLVNKVVSRSSKEVL